MTSLIIKDATAWRTIKELHIRDATTWRLIKELWVRDATTWRKVFQYFAPTGNNFACSLTTTATNPRIVWNDDGTAQIANAANVLVSTVSWGAPTVAGIGARYWVKFTLTSGTGVSGETLGVWLSLSSLRSLQMTAANNGNYKVAHLDYSLSTDSSGATVVATGTWTLESDRT